jgi:hypothetical protein
MNVSEFRRGFDKCRSFRHLKQSLRGFRVLACEVQRGRKDKVETKGSQTRRNLCARWHVPCHSFFREGGEKNEIYLFNTLSCACSDGNTVGSGSSSRSRAGACICGGRTLLEISKSKHKSLVKYHELYAAG